MDREDSVAGGGDPAGRRGNGDAGKPRPATAATGPIPPTDAPRSLDLNSLHKMSPEELAELAKKFGVFLHPTRTRHYHILDLARAALGAGSTVTGEGFIDQPGESIAFLRLGMGLPVLSKG